MSGAKSELVLIAAIAANGVIGAGGTLPWRLPEDLRRFRQLTLGHPVIMGRKTWQSIGKALPGRRNIVVTRQKGFVAEGASIAASLAAALELCRGVERAFVIGGSELYREALPLADVLELTELHRDYAGDATFPEFDRSHWREAEREAHTTADGTRFDFARYVRA